MASTRAWVGDPFWIADVLRAEGIDVVEFRGWQDRGHGDFKDIRGVMAHHTGSDNTSAAAIAYGRPDLAGPLSQLHIARNGTVRAFQRRTPGLNVDGIVGPVTAAALRLKVLPASEILLVADN